MVIGFGLGSGSTHLGASRAVSRNRSGGNPTVFRVQADRFDDEVEFVGAVDLARYAVGHAGPDELGFGEVTHPPRSGWLDELGRLKGGWATELGVARCAPYWLVQNWAPAPSATSWSRMY